MTIPCAIGLIIFGMFLLYIIVDSLMFKPIVSNTKTNANEVKELIRMAKYDIDPREFEFFCGQLLRECGYKDVRVTCGSNDGGKDIVAIDKDGEVVYVEVKQYSKAPIGRPLIQKLLGSASMSSVKKCIFITTSTFNDNAINCINSNIDLELWDTDNLYGIMRDLSNESLNRITMAAVMCKG